MLWRHYTKVRQLRRTEKRRAGGMGEGEEVVGTRKNKAEGREEQKGRKLRKTGDRPWMKGIEL